MRCSSTIRWAVWALVVCACGESKSSPDAADGGRVVCPESTLEPTGDCPPGTCVNGPACEPIFDDCGDNEISVMGGGCQRVGLPTDCWDGWLPTEDGGCEPILPADECPFGTMPIIGETECQPIRDCGTGPWGNIDIQPGAVFVDAAYDGSNGPSNGTETRPFTAIQDAVDDAPPGGQVVVAEGEYVQDVVIPQALSLEGRCPERVSLRAETATGAAVAILANDVQVRGVRVSGGAWGIVTVEATGVLIEQILAEDSAVAGVQIEYVAEATIRRALFDQNGWYGLTLVDGSTAELDSSVVANTSSIPGAAGISVDGGGQLDVRASLLVGNRETGLQVRGGSSAMLERVDVRDTQPQADDTRGVGVVLDGASRTTITRSSVTRNHTFGVSVTEGSELTIGESTVRETMPEPVDGRFGHGIYVEGESRLVANQCLLASNRDAGLAVGRDSQAEVDLTAIAGNKGRGIDVSWGSILSLRQSVIERNREVGVFLGGEASGELSDVTVRDTASNANGFWGDGIVVQVGASLDLVRSLLARNRHGGLYVNDSSTIDLDEVTVRDTEPQEADRTGGWAVDIVLGSTATMRECLIADNAVFGVAVGASTATLERVAVRRTGAALDGFWGEGIAAASEETVGDAHVTMSDLVVEESARAGIALFGATGTLGGSTIRRNVFSVVTQDGAELEMADDNSVFDNEHDDVSSPSIEPPPLVDPVPF